MLKKKKKKKMSAHFCMMGSLATIRNDQARYVFAQKGHSKLYAFKMSLHCHVLQVSYTVKLYLSEI
jgi:hypothetical protein